jgi:hypothetical protein
MAQMTRPKLSIKIGADPELFVKNEISGAFVSAHNLLPGDKANPFKLPMGGVQVDGVAAEFNINPASTQKEWLKSISNVLSLMERLLKKQNKHLTLHAVPYIYFSKLYFDDLPANVKILGCDPDWNANTGKVNPKPPGDKPMRTGAGHIHIGFLENELEYPEETEHFNSCCDLVQRLDYVLFPQSMLWDGDNTRRKMYGEPGSFRPKKYGLEYRVLSNAWLRNRETQAFVYDAAKAVTTMFCKGIPMNMVSDTQNVNHYYESLRDQHLPVILDKTYDYESVKKTAIP